MNKEDFIKKWSKHKYLGDSVYAHFDGYHIVLETRNGLPTDPSNTIALEPHVMDILKLYEAGIKKDIRQMNGWGEFENKEIE